MRKYYRITCNNIGIYEFLKKWIWETSDNPIEAWSSFINDNKNKWLSIPLVYKNENKIYCSYFTDKGYQLFLKNTLPLILEYLNKDIINVEELKKIQNKIVYVDDNQITVEIDKKVCGV